MPNGQSVDEKHSNTTLSEQFQNQISKLQKEVKSITLAHKYMTAHLVQELQ
jgi:quinolinate synthase